MLPPIGEGVNPQSRAQDGSSTTTSPRRSDGDFLGSGQGIPPVVQAFLAGRKAVIGGTATVFHLEERNAQSQRATTDLDIAILELTTASNAQGIWESLRDFFVSNNYSSQFLQSGKSQSFRFEAPEDRQDIPSIIEIFSEETVPNSDRWVHRIPDAEMSAIVLPESAIELSAQTKSCET